MSVEPSSEVLEGNRLSRHAEAYWKGTRCLLQKRSTPPVSAGDPGLTLGRLIGGIRVWDSWKNPSGSELIAFAFWPGDETDILRFSVCVADDDGAVQTGRTIRIDVNPVFAEYSVGSPSETTLRVLDKDASGAEVPLQQNPPCLPGQEPPQPPPPPPPPPPPASPPRSAHAWHLGRLEGASSAS